MTSTTDFDRLVAGWLESAAPADLSAEGLDAALATARSTSQRRGIGALLAGPAAWPNGGRASLAGLPPVVRIAILAALAGGLIAGGLFVGSRLRPPVAPPPVDPPPTVIPVDAIRVYDGRLTRVPGAPGDGFDSPIAVSNGQIIGFGDTQAIIWDVESRQFASGGPLSGRRSRPTPVLLADGRVLIIGSDLSQPDASGASSITTATAEVWDPRTRTSSPAVPLGTSRWIFGAIRLADGRVLVSGGLTTDGSEEFVADAEIFDPATATFKPTGSLTEPRIGHTMTLLPDGRVLLAGGLTGRFPGERAATTEIYDPSSGTFAASDALTAVAPNPDDTKYPLEARSPIVTLRGGQVLVPGLRCQEVHAYRADGLSDGVRATAIEIFDPSTGAFRPGGFMPHCVHDAFPLPNGELFVRGWWYEQAGPEAATERRWAGLYDPATSSVRKVQPPSVNAGPYVQTAVLPDGRVVFFGSGVEVME